MSGLLEGKNVLVIGVEKMNLLPTPQMTHVLACCSHWPSEGSRGMSFPMLFAEYAKGYQAKHKISDEDLELFRLVETADEAWQIIRKFHRL